MQINILKTEVENNTRWTARGYASVVPERASHNIEIRPWLISHWVCFLLLIKGHLRTYTLTKILPILILFLGEKGLVKNRHSGDTRDTFVVNLYFFQYLYIAFNFSLLVTISCINCECLWILVLGTSQNFSLFCIVSECNHITFLIDS